MFTTNPSDVHAQAEEQSNSIKVSPPMNKSAEASAEPCKMRLLVVLHIMNTQITSVFLTEFCFIAEIILRVIADGWTWTGPERCRPNPLCIYLLKSQVFYAWKR